MPSESLICTPKVGLNRQLIKVQVFLIQYKKISAVIPAKAGI
ncbi:hypothetical protein [Neisseria basseii]|nr:hypothetical protein [Neisseria basseii]